MRERDVFLVLDQMLHASFAHGYYELDFRIIWQTVITDVAELRRRLELIYEAAGERLGGAPQAPTTD
jgi:hypothetical protein